MSLPDKRKKDIVVFKNEFNEVALKGFKAVEIDLLFAIMSQLRNEGTNDVTLSFDQLRSLSKYNKSNALKPFVDDLESTYDKLIKLNIKFGSEKKWTKFVFFTKYSVDEEEQTVTISVNPEFEGLINKISKNFTKLELEEITSLSSSYSKNCYRLLKQFRSSGEVYITVEEFRRILDVPESYSYGGFNQRVLKQIEKELPNYFPNLKINRIKGMGKNSRKVVRLEFKFRNDDGLNKGNRTFRAEDGTYYEKYITDFTEEEIKKAYPETSKKD